MSRAVSSLPRNLAPSQNRVLAALPENIYSQVAQQLRTVSFATNEPVYNSGESIRLIYFPLDCVISSLAIMEDGATVEVSMVGREGITGMSAMIGGGISTNWTRVQIAGTAMRIKASVLKELFFEHEPLQQALLRSYRALITQISQRSVCNCRHTLAQRLCCWLLMIHDRVQNDELPLTQESIAQRLGARRAGVTTAACILQSEEILRYSRGHIKIRNRAGLETLACECYRIYRRAFDSVDKDLVKYVR
jgi:CRP-like cAMP-binding protein